MLKNAPVLAKSLVSKTKFKTKAKSPEILIVVGIASGIGAILAACKATTKAEEVIDEHKDKMDKIKEVKESGNPEYTEQDAKKDTAIVYFQTGVKMAKLYAPALVLEGVSVASILGSHNILKRRNIALATLAAATDKSFKEYRGRVVDRFGEEVDHQLKNNIMAEKIESEETDENGKTKKKSKKVEIADPDTQDVYVQLLTRHNPNYKENQQYMENWFGIVQQTLQNHLDIDGHLWLNDALKEMDMEPILPVGQYVGWMKYKKDGTRNNVLLKIKPVCSRDVNGVVVDAYAVEFNCDGYILDNFK